MPIFVNWNDQIMNSKVTYMTNPLISWYRNWQAVSLVNSLVQVTTILIGLPIWVRDILFLSLCLRIVRSREWFCVLFIYQSL